MKFPKFEHEGKTGEVVTLTAECDHPFLAGRLVATDTGSPAGFGTAIAEVAIDAVHQRPRNATATLSAFFAEGTPGNRLKFDPGKKFELTVHFFQDCKFTARFGAA